MKMKSCDHRSQLKSYCGGGGGWVGEKVNTGTSDLFMNINKNRKARTCQFNSNVNKETQINPQPWKQ